jgi:hypothetical protein
LVFSVREDIYKHIVRYRKDIEKKEGKSLLSFVSFVIYHFRFFSLVFCREKHPSDLCESERHTINIITVVAGKLIDDNRFGDSAGNDLTSFLQRQTGGDWHPHRQSRTGPWKNIL